MGHVIEQPDPNDHLLERMLSRSNMQAAWQRVKSNKGVAGVDGMSTPATSGASAARCGRARSVRPQR